MNIYVSNLKFSLTEQEIREIFNKFGEVQNVKIITDRATGRSKGFCFVEMSDDDGAVAIEQLDGKELFGRTLKVNVARDKTDDAPRFNRGPRPGGNNFRQGGGNGGNRGGGGRSYRED